MYPFSVEAFLSQTDRLVPLQDPVLAFSRESWRIAHQITKADPYLSSRSSIWYNKKLLIDKKSFFWDKWIKSGIHIFEDVMGDVGFRSFDEIKNKYNLCNSDFWRFLQIRHCILSNKEHIQHGTTGIQEISPKIGDKNRGASKFYEFITSTQVPKLNGLKVCWDRDLDWEIPEIDWKKLCASWYCYSRETQSQLICYKILNRSYWTPSKLARLKLRNSDICWRCNRKVGTLVHMLYDCDKTNDMWNEIISFLNKMFGILLIKNPTLCLLGLLPDNVQMSKRLKSWCRLAMITGCRITLRHWKSPTFSTFKEWIEVLSSMASYERVTYRVAGKEDLFNEVWGPFLAQLLDMKG